MGFAGAGAGYGFAGFRGIVGFIAFGDMQLH